MKMVKYVKEELIHFVKHIKSMTNVGMDKHLCDHLLWMIDEHSKSQQTHNKQVEKLKKKIDDICKIVGNGTNENVSMRHQIYSIRRILSDDMNKRNKPNIQKVGGK